MYLPAPKTPAASGPEITLAPEPGSSGRRTARSPPASRPERVPAQADLALGVDDVGRTDGAVQPDRCLPGWRRCHPHRPAVPGRLLAGLPATGSVSAETFQIPVQTSQPGANRFRVVDSDSGLESNEIQVTIG